VTRPVPLLTPTGVGISFLPGRYRKIKDKKLREENKLKTSSSKHQSQMKDVNNLTPHSQDPPQCESLNPCAIKANGAHFREPRWGIWEMGDWG